MNIFNRIVVILLLIFFVVVSIISIVNVFTDAFSWSDIATSVFNPAVNLPRYTATLLLMLVIAVCIALLLLEFYRRKRKIVKINNVGSGKAMITVETIAQQIKDSVLRIGGIKNLKTEITLKSGGIIISMLVEITQNINIPEKMTEIISAAKLVCTEKLNIKVVDARLTITNLISDGTGPEHREPNTPQKQSTSGTFGSSAESRQPDQSGAQNKDGAVKDSLKQMQLTKLDGDNREKGIEITDTALAEESDNS